MNTKRFQHTNQLSDQDEANSNEEVVSPKGDRNLKNSEEIYHVDDVLDADDVSSG